MQTSLNLTHFDLATPDGVITHLHKIDDETTEAIVNIQEISPNFVGFQIDRDRVFFNLKSTLAQLGLDGIGFDYQFDRAKLSAEIKIHLVAVGSLAREILKLLTVGAYIGKLFAADDRRRVRDPFYLSRMFGRADRWGSPLLSLGGSHGSSDLILEKVDGRTIAYLALQQGKVYYDSSIYGFLPTLAKSLVSDMSVRNFVRLHQEWEADVPRNVEQGELLLVKTLPLHIRTVFARVVDEHLSEGYRHTTASILEPDTKGSGDIYELYGSCKRELTDIPLEFYTLEPYKEYVYFSDRDQLQSCIENPEALFTAFSTAPEPIENRASVFIVKGEQLLNLEPADWISKKTFFHEFPGSNQSSRQALMIQRYIEQQPDYPYLKAISDNLITSQGILLTRYFPSPLIKRMLLDTQVQEHLAGIYFQYPSKSHGEFFSAEDRTMLHDLNKFAIPVYWVDDKTGKILRYVEKPDRDSGMFVPLDKISLFLKSTVFGLYGSNLSEGAFEPEIETLLKGILEMREEIDHPLLNLEKPLSLVTGGGPGVMEMGNKVARQLNILSCANIMDFRLHDESIINEQRQNPYIEAKMTYRLDKLVERQSEFNLDFPIFLIGGIGTDFEYTLEEVRRKVGTTLAHPIILFGPKDYWKSKITHRFLCNKKHGTIAGSEWISNCFYCIENASQGLEIYRKFFLGQLSIGPEGPIYPKGFATLDDLG